MKPMNPPFERYSITEDGIVYSCIKREPSIMKPFLDKDGYHRVSIMTTDSKKKKVIISRKVYEAYGLQDAEGLVVRHMDGDKNNNHISNLEVGTVTENNRDKQRHGTQCKGEKHGRAKLSSESVLFIRSSNMSRIELASKFKVSKALIDKVINRDIWKHI